MSLISEAGFQKLAIGAPCVNTEGKVFSVLGIYRKEFINRQYHEIPIFPNFSHED